MVFLPALNFFECPAKGYKNQVIELGKGTRDAVPVFITFKWVFIIFI